MSQADEIFLHNLREILSSEWEDDNRAVWEDGTPIQTKRAILIDNVYDLSKEFPAGTLRPVAFKTCFREIDWIFRQRSNRTQDFKGRVWDQWADEEGTIGKAYGYQIAKPTMGYTNQMDYILGELKRNPSSRRLVMEMWNVDDLEEMNLPPCAHHIQFLAKDGVLNMILKQRSNDYLVAGMFNVVEYSLLLYMVARHAGMEVGILKHVIGDCHIYNKHIDQAQEMVARKPFKAPKLWINPEKTDFYSFTEDDFRLIDYDAHPQLKLEVAV